MTQFRLAKRSGNGVSMGLLARPRSPVDRPRRPAVGRWLDMSLLTKGPGAHAALARQGSLLGCGREKRPDGAEPGGKEVAGGTARLFPAKPFVGGDDLDGQAVGGGVIPALVVGDKGQVPASGCLGGVLRSPQFAFQDLGIGYVVGDLHDFLDAPSLAYKEIRLRGLVFPVVDVASLGQMASAQFQIDKRFETPPQVFAHEGVGAHVHEGDIHGIQLGVHQPLRRFRGILLHFAQQVGLFEEGQVVARGVVAGDVEDAREVRHRGLCRDDVEDVVRQRLQGLRIADLVARADVALHDGLHKGRDVADAVPFLQQFGEPAAMQVLIESGHALCGFLRARREPGSDALAGTILRERERQQPGFHVASRQVRRKLARQELGVGPGDDQPHLLAQQAVREKEPLGDVLHLVDEQHLEVPIDLVKRKEQVVQVVAGQFGKALVVEIDVCERQPRLLQDIHAQRGLAAPSDPDHDLRQLARQVQVRLFRPGAVVRRVESIDLQLFLVQEDLFQGLQFHADLIPQRRQNGNSGSFFDIKTAIEEVFSGVKLQWRKIFRGLSGGGCQIRVPGDEWRGWKERMM